MNSGSQGTRIDAKPPVAGPFLKKPAAMGRIADLFFKDKKKNKKKKKTATISDAPIRIANTLWASSCSKMWARLLVTLSYPLCEESF